MGYSKSLFVQLPSQSSFFECAICQDILRDPISGVECGHSFCEDCINQWVAEHKSCPTCRTNLSNDEESDDDDSSTDSDDSDQPALNTTRNIALRRLILDLQVRCSNQRETSTNDRTMKGASATRPIESGTTNTATELNEERASSSSPRPTEMIVLKGGAGNRNDGNSEGTASSSEDGNTTASTVTTRTEPDVSNNNNNNNNNNAICKSIPVCCTWRGTLADYNTKHKGECPYEQVTCLVEGCDHSCLRCDLEAHMSASNGINFVSHMKHLVEAQTAQVQESLKEQADRIHDTLERRVIQKMDDDRVHDYISRFCRLWKHQQKRPDWLKDVVVYRPTSLENPNPVLKSLLVGIPFDGIITTANQSRARIPVLFTWNSITQPPTVQFPGNYWELSQVGINGTIFEVWIHDHWSPDLSILEIILMIRCGILEDSSNHYTLEQRLSEDVTGDPGDSLFLSKLDKFEPAISKDWCLVMGGNEKGCNTGNKSQRLSYCWCFPSFLSPSHQKQNEFLVPREWA